MIEAIAAYKLYERYTNKKEKFNERKWKEDEYNSADIATLGFFGIILFLLLILFIVIPITIAACYLSWTSNTAIQWGTGFKVLFAFFAFLAPFHYLINHLIHKYDLLTYIEKIKLPTQNNLIQ